MILSDAEKHEITKLLTRIYQEILAIETEHELLAGEGDMRQRIEHFHDVVRLVFSEDTAAIEGSPRLSTEMLAYDMQCLRYVQQQPTAPFKAGGHKRSASTDLTTTTPNITTTPKRISRTQREQLSRLYQHYAVLYAALLKPVADNDFEDRMHHLDEDVRDINSLIDALENSAPNASQIAGLAAMIEDAQLRSEMQAFLQAGGLQKKSTVKKLITYLKQRKKDKDAAISALDKAHMGFATSQLAVYEHSKDLLKTLAEKGMNLIGKFVQNAVEQTQRQMGR